MPIITRSHGSVRVLWGRPSKSMGKGKIWPSADRKPLNRSSPHLNHVIMSRTSTTKQNFGSILSGVLLPIYANYTPSSVCYFTFFGSSPRLSARPLDGFWRSIRHTTRFCARKCLLGVRKFKLNIELIYSKNSKKKYSGAYGRHLKILQTVITSVVYNTES